MCSHVCRFRRSCCEFCSTKPQGALKGASLRGQRGKGGPNVGCPQEVCRFCLGVPQKGTAERGHADFVRFCLICADLRRFCPIFAGVLQTLENKAPIQTKSDKIPFGPTPFGKSRLSLSGFPNMPFVKCPSGFAEVPYHAPPFSLQLKESLNSKELTQWARRDRLMSRGKKLPRDNFCLSLVSQLPSPRVNFERG